MLEYEPSWFVDFTYGPAMLLLGVFALLTDAFRADAYRADGAG